MKKYSAYLPYAAGFAISLIFGMSFMFTKDALSNMAPMTLLAARFAVAALTLSLLVLTGLIKVSYGGKPWKTLLLLSLFQPITYFICETLGVKLTSSSEAGMMIALIPVLVTILAVIFLGERPTNKQYVFILLSVSGVLFIIIKSGGMEVGGHFFGLLFLLGAVFAAGVYNILSRKLSTSFTPVEITLVMMWAGAITFNSAAVITGLKDHSLGQAIHSLMSLSSWVSILYLGILSSICAFFMFNFMLSKITASRASVFSNLTTIVSILAGVFIRHEPFHLYQLMGGILIVLGVWGTNYFAESSK